MILKTRLSKRIHINDINEIVLLAKGDSNAREAVYNLAFDDNDTLSTNALWIMTHYSEAENKWLYLKQKDLINELLNTQNSSKRRLILTILQKQLLTAPLNIKLLDFCLQQMVSIKEPPGIIALCMKLAYEMCRNTPELLQEYAAVIEILEPTSLPPSLRCSRKNIMKAMQTGKQLE